MQGRVSLALPSRRPSETTAKKDSALPKTFLSLGVGPGIGLATAARFAREGFSLVLTSRNPGRLEPALAPLRATGAKIVLEPVDAADPGAVARVVTAHAADLEVIHHNAGALRYAGGHLAMEPIDSLTVEQISSDIAVNITSALVAISTALPAMRARKSGAILLTGGGLGLQPFAPLLTLSIGKAGIRTMAQALFEPAKADGVHVATVTVCKEVHPNSSEAAEVADRFWALYDAAPADWRWEDTY